MSKPVDEILNSIIEEHARCEKDHAELEAKSLFRLLNFCPPLKPGVPLLDKKATNENLSDT